MNREMKLVFKPMSGSSDKYTHSGNTAYGCDNCLVMKKPADKSFDLCAGCKTAHYCVRLSFKLDSRSTQLTQIIESGV